MKWFWGLSAVYFLIAGHELVTVFCLSALAITDLDDRLTKLEKSINPSGEQHD